MARLFAVPTPGLDFALVVSKIFAALTLVGVLGTVIQLSQYVFPSEDLPLSAIPYYNSLPQEMQNNIIYFGMDYFVMYYDALRVVHAIMPLVSECKIRSLWIFSLHFFVMALAFCCDLAKLGILIWGKSKCSQIWYCITPPSPYAGHNESVPFDIQFYVCIYFIAEAVAQVLFYCFLVRRLAKNAIRDEEDFTGKIDISGHAPRRYERLELDYV